MTICIVLDYYRCDECFAAIALADTLEKVGFSVSLFPFEEKVTRLFPKWDNCIRRNSAEPFMTRLKEYNSVVFFDLPSVDTLAAVKDLGKRSYYVCNWSAISDETVNYIGNFDTVVCPHRCVQRLLKDFVDESKLVVLPWSLDLPKTVSRHETRPDKIGITWNLDGSQLTEQPPAMLKVLAKVLSRKNVFLTVFYNGQTTNPKNSLLKALQNDYPDRVELVKNPSLEQQVLMSSLHDFSVWPSQSESFGIPGLVNLAASLPTLALDHPIVGDIIKHNVSGYLVSCDLSFNKYGVPYAQFSPEEFQKALDDLINNIDLIKEIRKNTAQLITRRYEFEHSARRLFDV